MLNGIGGILKFKHLLDDLEIYDNRKNNQDRLHRKKEPVTNLLRED